MSTAEFAKKLGVTASDLGTVGGSLALFNAGELAKKFGIPVSVFGTDGTGVDSFNAGGLAKKFGIPTSVFGTDGTDGSLFNTAELGTIRAGGTSAPGLLSTAEFENKFGMLDPVDEVSGADTLLVSGVGAVRDITGSCLAGVAVEDCSRKDGASLGDSFDSFATGVDALTVAAGLVSENGNEVIGGSFAPVKSC